MRVSRNTSILEGTCVSNTSINKYCAEVCLLAIFDLFDPASRLQFSRTSQIPPMNRNSRYKTISSRIPPEFGGPLLQHATANLLPIMTSIITKYDWYFKERQFCYKVRRLWQSATEKRISVSVA